MQSKVFYQPLLAVTWDAVAPSRGCGLLRSFCAKGGREAKKKTPPPIKILEEDLDEKFVKGSGPGGQKINKVRNCVQLIHKPTGISVSCQDARELHANRSIARTRLQEKVEFHLLGEESKTGRRIAQLRNRKARSQRKSRKKHQNGVAPSPESGDTSKSAKGGKAKAQNSEVSSSDSDDYFDSETGDDFSDEDEGTDEESTESPRR